MKKKIATFLILLVGCLSILSGCNLFSTNNTSGLNSIVATSGKYQITREELVSAYNNSGYQYNQYYGMSMQEAIQKTIDDLINRKYLLDYIEQESQTNTSLKLTDRELSDVIYETWDYVDSSIKSVSEQIEKELGLYKQKETTDSSSQSSSDFSGYSPYSTKFYVQDGKIYLKDSLETSSSNRPVFEDITEQTAYNTLHNYVLSVNSSNKDFEKIVWARYVSILKKNMSSSGKNYVNDQEVFTAHIDEVFKSNLEVAKLKKFQSVYEASYGFDANTNYLNEKTLEDIVSAYDKIYTSNKDAYQTSKAKDAKAKTYYEALTKNREKFFYYGEGEETMLTCIHILIKLDSTQTSNLTSLKDDPYIQLNTDEVLDATKSTKTTFATERNPETGEVVAENTKISVEDLYKNLLAEISVVPKDENYLESVIEIFNKYVYTYNVDPGIMNAKFDYVLGTSTTKMVDSFTQTVRSLYNNGVKDVSSDVLEEYPLGVGFAGAISKPVLEENSDYSGYHIVLFTGTLQNIDPQTITVANVFEKLNSAKTSISYNQTLFEYFYEKCANTAYSEYESDLLASIKSKPVYNEDNYSDLYR